ncbi:unnamed protein product [Spirodela intermedia]|uniref:Uncharacterized protein n=1 Tax=Spirodela intermedia TaxID=51605 RepID=A0A7I8L320_SPIIN|nr:unnamed protein product [Spirodela intermedia]
MAEAAAEAFELRNGSVAVKVSNWPATITSLLLPDSHDDRKTSKAAHDQVF